MNTILFVTFLALGARFCVQAASTTPPIIPISNSSTETPGSETSSNPSTIPAGTSPEPASFVPFTSEEPLSTGSSMKPNTMSSAPPSVNTRSSSPSSGTGTQTTPSVQPTPAPKTSGFDGASFGGGIGLGLGISIIGLIVYKVYSSKRAVDYNKI